MVITGFRIKKNRVRSIDFKKKNSDIILNLLLTTTLLCKNAYAGSVAESVMPLVRILQDLAEPVAYGFCIKGFLQIMSGDEHSGMKSIKGAIGGFIGVRWLPQLFNIIKKINF